MTRATPTRRLRAELHQGRPFASPAETATVALLRTAGTARRALERAVAGSGLTHQQYNVLRILRGAGPAGLPTLAIAARLIEETPGITRLVAGLAARRLLRRTRRAEDRRVVTCRITPAGRALLDRLDGPVTRAAETLMDSLTPAAQARLLALLDTVRTGAADAPGTGRGRN